MMKRLAVGRFFPLTGGNRQSANRRFLSSVTRDSGDDDDDEQEKPPGSSPLPTYPANAPTLISVCKILENPSSSSHLSELLQPYANDISPALIAMVIQEQRSLSQAQLLFQWASRVVRPDEYAYHSLLIKLGDFKQFADMWKLVDDMKCQGYRIDSTTLSILVKAYGSAGMPHEAMEVCRRAQHEFNVAIDTRMYTTLLSVLFKAKLIDDARSMYKQMLKDVCALDGSVWATLIRGFGKNGCAKEAEACWDHMLHKGVQPKVVHYNALIKGLCESKSMNKALFMLMAMQEQGLKPNAYSFNPIIGALCKLNRFPEALNIFSSMSKNCVPNQATCNILLEGLFFNENVSKACELFEKMEEIGLVDTRSYALLTAGLKRAKQRDKLFSICKDLHVKKHGNVDDVVSNVLLQCLCEGHDVNEAVAFFNGLRNPNVASYAMMINCLCRAWKLDEAMMLLSEMNDKGCKPNAFCCAPLMGALLKAGRLVDGVNVFDDMVRRGIETNDVTCGFLLRKLSEARMADEVLRVCNHVVDSSVAINNADFDLSIKCLEIAGKTEAIDSLRRELCIRKQAWKASNQRLTSGRGET